MDDTSFDIVSLAVEIMATLLVVGFIGLAISLSTNMQKTYQREADIQVMMQEMAIYSRYDGTVVSGSDVIEAVYSYASNDFYVTIGGSAWNKSSPSPWGSTKYGPGNMPSGLNINPTTTYKAELVYADNGQVTEIHFYQ